MKEEFCIMPPSDRYSTERFPNSARHEIFFGANRKKSIKYGLVVFLTHEMHNLNTKLSVHFNKDFNMWLKKEGQKAAMNYYGWTIDDFRKEFGKNYL